MVTDVQVLYAVQADQWGGLGLFAAQDVAAGTLIWDFAKASIKEYSNEEAKVGAVTGRVEPASVSVLWPCTSARTSINKPPMRCAF